MQFTGGHNSRLFFQSVSYLEKCPGAIGDGVLSVHNFELMV